MTDAYIETIEGWETTATASTKGRTPGVFHYTKKSQNLYIKFHNACYVMETSGWVYLISCDNYPSDCNKVGKTTQDPMCRLKEMASVEGLMDSIPLKLEFAKKVPNCTDTEKLIHAIFKGNRVPGKEWFKGVSRHSFLLVFELMPGEEWYTGITLTPKKIIVPRRTPLETVFVEGDKVRSKENPERVVEYDASKKCFIDRNTGDVFTSLKALEVTPSKSSWTKCEVLVKNDWIRVSDYRDTKFNTPISECDDDDDEESTETPSVTA